MGTGLWWFIDRWWTPHRLKPIYPIHSLDKGVMLSLRPALSTFCFGTHLDVDLSDSIVFRQCCKPEVASSMRSQLEPKVFNVLSFPPWIRSFFCRTYSITMGNKLLRQLLSHRLQFWIRSDRASFNNSVWCALIVSAPTRRLVNGPPHLE